MATYHFSMEKILSYRKQLEDRAKAELGHIQASLMKEQEKHAYLKKEKIAKEDSLIKIIVANERWLVENYIKALKNDILVQERKINSLEKKLLAAKEKLAICSKDKLILEKLKEKNEIKFKEEEHYKEQREYDEIASFRFKAVID